MIYTKGTVLNVYQAILDRTLDTQLIAMSSSSFVIKNEDERQIQYNASQPSFRIKKAGKSEHLTELMCLNSEAFLDLCVIFEKSEAVLQERCIEQVDQLNEVRLLREHLHPNNEINIQYR